MAADIKRIEAEVYSLSSRERARLAMDLIKSLDDHDDADAEELWVLSTFLCKMFIGQFLKERQAFTHFSNRG